MPIERVEEREACLFGKSRDAERGVTAPGGRGSTAEASNEPKLSCLFEQLTEATLARKQRLRPFAFDNEADSMPMLCEVDRVHERVVAFARLIREYCEQELSFHWMKLAGDSGPPALPVQLCQQMLEITR